MILPFAAARHRLFADDRGADCVHEERDRDGAIRPDRKRRDNDVPAGLVFDVSSYG
jgi:hypothetical protein